jgi:hypothetical protein
VLFPPGPGASTLKIRLNTSSGKEKPQSSLKKPGKADAGPGLAALIIKLVLGKISPFLNRVVRRDYVNFL